MPPTLPSWDPHLTVATLVEKDGRFLMVEELSQGKPVINQPAGHLEPYESLVAGARRETREETGWRVEITHFLGIYVYTAPANGVTYFRYAFIGQPLESGKPDHQDDENILATHWLSLDEIRKRPLRSPLVVKCVEDYLQGKRFPLDMIYEHPLPA